MFNIDISHAPHLYAYGAAGLLTLSAFALLVLEFRRVGSTPWPEWHNSRNTVLYRTLGPATRLQAPGAGAVRTKATPRGATRRFCTARAAAKWLTTYRPRRP